MNSIRILFFLTVFLSFLKVKAQNFADQGEGKVIVERFLSLNPSPELSKPYQTYTFYIKNYKILREEPEIIVPQRKINLDSLSRTTPIYDENGNEGGTVTSSITASIRKTKYLLDLKSKTTFVVGHKNGKTYYYQTEMKDFLEDFYRLFFEISKFSDYKKIEFKKNSKVIAGNFCDEALLDLNLKNINKEPIKASLWVTKNKLPIKSLLDNMFNETSPFSILSATFPMDKVNGGPTYYLTFAVKEIKEEKIPDEKFEIPADAILLTKTDWENYSFDH